MIFEQRLGVTGAFMFSLQWETLGHLVAGDKMVPFC